MKLTITHTTRYCYDTPVNYGLQQVRLTPVSGPMQTVLDWNIDIVGGNSELQFADQHKNQTLLVQADQNATEVIFTASGTVDTIDTAGVLGNVYGPVPLWHFRQHTARTTPGKAIRALARDLNNSVDLLADLHALSVSILSAAPYNTTSTIAGTTAEEALQLGGGVCQDHSQIFIAAARAAGIPARYVSGYLMMDGRVDQDASHAWAEAHIDGLGWVGFDVSNGISPDERYVRIAVGRDSKEAAPISGMRLGNANESMIVSLQVQQ
ncbi:transglutaminase family protein [Yoonia sediminilitoris]|uniref:Transglutaminase-like putative cysteine protease n=1 Tax=Yoonia sediminilitoris TaxID=1286148 RepID=A0A2T6KA05_9RHOB|nr:transglutaminase family protein [Yoonia sediminilitoris]PUB11579.1 transglutaminase-like putative cysteine protease [Yoonia sediminilitoris]RCW91779.1 transglutaminase-like putative cysteine protease [Yoonia sediminilitoris]